MKRNARAEIRRVDKILLDHENESWHYWYGYSLGLSMAGKMPDKIKKWKDSDNETMSAIHDGFSKAITWLESKVKPGRPPKYDQWFNRIKVSSKVHNALLKIAVGSGKNVPDVRRDAYKEYVANHG